jgi:glucose 1-dehydrogenase
MENHLKLSGRLALVTGAGRGIGKGCALELARLGADVVVNDRPGGADLAETVREVHALGRCCTAVEADVFTRTGCEALVQQALAVAGRIDILVSNPALSRRADFLDFDPAMFEKVIAGTLTSGFHVAQLVAQHIVGRGGGGKIVFISSIHAIMPYARSVAYNAAKAGLSHMAVSIAVELAKHRINVNAIEPGWIDTPGERETFGNEQLAARAATLPLGRLGTPADIGRAAAFLASDDADYITGAILRVDGGFWWKDCRPEGLMATPRP